MLGSQNGTFRSCTSYIQRYENILPWLAKNVHCILAKKKKKKEKKTCILEKNMILAKKKKTDTGQLKKNKYAWTYLQKKKSVCAKFVLIQMYYQ